MTKHVFGTILGIENIWTDDWVDFVGGIKGMDELENRCNHDCVAAFSMFPT
jgi:uncharacterized protein (DUF1015 family)